MDKNSESTLVKPVSSYDVLAERFQGGHQASRYHSVLSFRQRLRVVQQMAGQREGSLILDAGCGAGLYSESLTVRNTVAGLDLSYEMNRVALKKGLLAIQGDLQALPFKPASFDLVLSVEVLQHFKEPEAVLTELAGLVRPGGHLLIASLHPGSLLHLFYRPFGAYKGLHFHSSKDICGILSGLNFSIQRTRFLAYPFGLVWDDTNPMLPFSFLASSWVIAAIRK